MIKILKLALFLVTSLLLVILLWKNSFLLSTSLVVLFLIKHKIIPIKNEFFWFIAIFIFSYFAEILLVNFTKAWSYSSEYLFGVPVWASVFWSVIGVTSFSIFSLINEEGR